VAVADVFDALTSERPYKKPWPLEDAAGYLREQRGLHFDPQCVDVFLAAWPQVLAIRQRFADEPKAPAVLAAQPDGAAA
jgi:putative two-component system response regulator